MATINGVEFNLKNSNIQINKRNQYIPIVGGCLNSMNEDGTDGLRIEISGFETSRTTYDSIIKEFMGQGVQSLVINSGWEYRVYAAHLMPTLTSGHGNEKYFTYRISMISKTPYAYTVSDITDTETITTINQEWTVTPTGNSTVSTPVGVEITADNTPGSDILKQQLLNY